VRGVQRCPASSGSGRAVTAAASCASADGAGSSAAGVGRVQLGHLDVDEARGREILHAAAGGQAIPAGETVVQRFMAESSLTVVEGVQSDPRFVRCQRLVSSG
jgi:hypothetical protein